MNTQRYTPSQALQKIRQFCAYQERSHTEVENKLYVYGLTTNETGDIISKMIDENFLNEERFAIQFAGGKFRIKKWGRIKIKHELLQKGVSIYCIKKALSLINHVDYNAAFNKLAQLKLLSLKSEKNIFIKKRKLHDHLLAKGYERELIRQLTNSL